MYSQPVVRIEHNKDLALQYINSFRYQIKVTHNYICHKDCFNWDEFDSASIEAFSDIASLINVEFTNFVKEFNIEPRSIDKSASLSGDLYSKYFTFFSEFFLELIPKNEIESLSKYLSIFSSKFYLEQVPTDLNIDRFITNAVDLLVRNGLINDNYKYRLLSLLYAHHIRMLGLGIIFDIPLLMFACIVGLQVHGGFIPDEYHMYFFDYKEQKKR